MKLFMKHILSLLILFLVAIVQSCGVLINPTYMRQSEAEKTKLKPEDLTFDYVTNGKAFEKDSSNTCYVINADNIKDIVKESGDNFTMLVSLYYFCEYSRRYFDSVCIYCRENSVKLLAIDVTDWLYQKQIKDFLKTSGYYYPVFALDIYRYGGDSDNRKKWRRFAKEICDSKVPDTKLYGNNDVILLNNLCEVLVCGNFRELKGVIDSIVHSEK